jgi:F-type H+-transporting ATPase subunit delta
MASHMTMLARPYATAAFEYALEHNALLSFDHALQKAAMIAKDPLMKALLSRPGVSKDAILEIFSDILNKDLSAPLKNFLQILAENNRMPLIPDIAHLFHGFYEEHQKQTTVVVTSATDLDQRYYDLLSNSLSKRLQRKVTLKCETDPTLLGGAIVRAGDLVIDGSIRGKLNRLLESL